MKRIRNTTFLIATLLGAPALYSEQKATILDQAKSTATAVGEATVSTAKELKANAKAAKEKTQSLIKEKKAAHERSQAVQKVNDAASSAARETKKNYKKLTN